MATLLTSGALWTALPARAANFNVATEGQLSSAISSAGNGDTITFTANITLGSNLPIIEKNLTFNGGNFTLSGNNVNRGLFVKSGSVAVNDLTIANAVAQGGNGGIPNNWGGGGGGGAGLGGALFVGEGATVAVTNVILKDGKALGGKGGSGTTGNSFYESGGGGGYYPTGADGENAFVFSSGNGGAGNGGDGFYNSAGGNGGFGGGGGGGNTGGNGGFGGGGGGTNDSVPSHGGKAGFGGGTGSSPGGGGGAGMGGAIFVQAGGALLINGTLGISGNTVAGGTAGGNGSPGGGYGNGLFLAGNGTLTLQPGAGQTQTMADVIVDQTGVGGTGANAGAWSLVKNAPGTTILTGANTYTGGTTVNSGILQGNTVSLRGNFTNNAQVEFNQADAGTFAGTITGTGSVTKTGAGALSLTGTNTFSGGLLVKAGTLLFGSDAALGAAGRGITLDQATIGAIPGGTLDPITVARPLAIANGATLYSNSYIPGGAYQGGDSIWTGVISGSGGLFKTGNGTVTLGGANTFTGGTTVSAGILKFSTDANLGAAGSGITLNGGSIGTTDAAAGGLVINRSLTLAARGGISVGRNPLTWNGSIGGAGQFVKSGQGELWLTGTNTYTGGTSVVEAGNLRIESDDKLGAAGAGIELNNNGGLRASQSFVTVRNILLDTGGGVFSVDAGKILEVVGTISGPGSLTTTGAGTLLLSGNNTFAGPIYNNGGTIQGDTNSLRNEIKLAPVAGFARSITFDQGFDGTYAGAITGNGSLLKVGTGMLTLSGTNDYSDGTQVQIGTLRGTSTSLQGNITNNAALIFDQVFDGTYAGNMSGIGTLTKNGTGKVTLTGTSAVGGGTTINAGGLAVNGPLTSDVVVNKGGALSGAGNIKGDISNNGGTIIPGNSIGHMTIDGNFTFNGGTLGIEVNAQGDSDRISVVGAGHKVTINAGLLQIIPQAGVYVPNTKYTIITTEAGGTVWLGDVAGGVGFLTPQVSLDGGVISVSLALPAGAFRAAGQTVNQQAVGSALDRIAAAGNVGGLVATMANVNPSQGGQALQALSGQPYADLGTTTIQSSQLFMGALGRQIAAARGAGPARGNSVALAEVCDTACEASGLAPESRFAGWLSGLGATGGVAGNGNAGTLTYSMGGTAFGIDYRLDPRFVVGLAGGYVFGTQWVNGFSGAGYADTLSIAAYGSFTQGAFYADALAGYANAASRMQRIVAAPGLATGIANGSTSANQFLGQVETGWRFDLSAPTRTSITPFAQLQVAAANQAGFTESGSSAYNLTVAAQATTSVRTTFGADFTTRFDLGESTPLELGLRLGWMHEFADTTRPMTAAFAGLTGSQFTVFGAAPQRDSAVVGFAANSALDERTSLFFAYDGQVGGGTTNHALRAGFRLIW